MARACTNHPLDMKKAQTCHISCQAYHSLLNVMEKSALCAQLQYV